MVDLARRILQFVGSPAKLAEDPKMALPLLPRQSSLFATVKCACQSLKALLEAGVGAHHSDSLLKTYQRFNACIAPVEAPRPPENDSASAAVAKMRSAGAGSNRFVSSQFVWLFTHLVHLSRHGLRSSYYIWRRGF